MYYCEHCRKIFEEPSIEHTTYESYYGVSSEFNTYNSLDVKRCPYCGSDDLSEYEEESEEEEDEI